MMRFCLVAAPKITAYEIEKVVRQNKRSKCKDVSHTDSDSFHEIDSSSMGSCSLNPFSTQVKKEH